MGLFTGTASTPRRRTSSTPLKRRSLGGSKRIVSNSTQTLNAVPIVTTEPSPNGGATATPPSLKQQDSVRIDAASDEDPELDLADLQSDNVLLYDRRIPLDEALGLSSLHPAEPSFLERILEYVSAHYLDCFGITHQDEIIRHHNRLVPFFAKAPRFLSIHSLKKKELDRDFTDVPDTNETCARKELCQGRC